MTRTPPLLAAALCATGLAACGGATGNPTLLLRQAKQLIDQAPSAHFTLTTANTSIVSSGAALLGGSGDMKRPDSFAGTLEVGVGGFDVGVQVVSVGGTFYARDPLSGRFTVANPAAYGFGDPGKLLDPGGGLSSLLLQCRQPSLQGDDRYNGETLHEVSCTLPGPPVAALLTSADSSQPVSATFGMDASSGQLRRVVLSGPFFNAHQANTFTLIADNYGENVSITPPATGS